MYERILVHFSCDRAVAKAVRLIVVVDLAWWTLQIHRHRAERGESEIGTLKTKQKTCGNVSARFEI